MAQTTFLVPNVLLAVVPLDGGRVLLALTPPIVRVTGSPFLRAVQAHLAAFRSAAIF
jgi:Zn-dependent protease